MLKIRLRYIGFITLIQPIDNKNVHMYTEKSF